MLAGVHREVIDTDTPVEGYSAQKITMVLGCKLKAGLHRESQRIAGVRTMKDTGNT